MLFCSKSNEGAALATVVLAFCFINPTTASISDIFDQGKDISLSEDNHDHRSIINNYHDSQDGLALLERFIAQHHVNFRSTEKHAYP